MPKLTLPSLMVNFHDAAAMCGIYSEAWWELHENHKVPDPIVIDGQHLWSVAELTAWVDAGCPNRKNWAEVQAIQILQSLR